MTSNDDALDFLDQAQQASSKKQRSSRPRSEDFSTGLDDVTPRAAAKATGSKSMAGNYKRYTMYLPPEDIDRLKEVAADIGLSQAETGRWFVQHMLDLYQEGLRPETEPIVIRRRLKSD